ncbi:MAG: ribosome small subunit-dependent GTPase A [Thermoleophilia bacterium]|nr:ribosome small subunit-dependent GTPase A [Thermoleophilia bacterium]
MSGPSASVLVDGRELEVPILPRMPGGPPVAGDDVRLVERGGQPRLEEILERRTLLSRGEFGSRNRARPLVANADMLLVVAAAVDPPFRPRLVDRYMVAAALGGLEPALAITKLDLVEDRAALDEQLAVYRDVGYPVEVGSTFDPGFVRRIRSLIGDRIAALAGHSGVGKSSLTQELTGVHRAVGEVSRKIGKGRHTTSDPRLIPMPGGGAVVDTAGVRMFHLPPMDAEDLGAGFPEIAAASRDCRFRGCRHAGEPGCAVVGRVHPDRLDSYLRLLDTV